MNVGSNSCRNLETLPPLFDRSPHTSDDEEVSEENSASLPTSPVPESTHKEDNDNIDNRETLHVDPDIRDILGLDEKDDKDKLPVVDPALVLIWQKLINTGLKKETHNEIMLNYPRTIPHPRATTLSMIAAKISGQLTL
ncbi:uncharacterized protein LOC131666787 isoform X2 [Phymastichus coffea]|uniref:uncharacterized protein LOC131666787 isoform X2 n=1 Tax=Phymastichus coffea TaxID=108790 RepID=UPI00273AE1B6|nr:uncharacterized protein LOC131666787 isoform X2 [Phymastichus coffea]